MIQLDKFKLERPTPTFTTSVCLSAAKKSLYTKNIFGAVGLRMFYNAFSYLRPGNVWKLLLNRRVPRERLNQSASSFDSTLITIYLFVCLTDGSLAMDGRIVASRPHYPASARHSGRRDGAAVLCCSMDRLRRQTARQVASLFGPLPHPQRVGPPMGFVFHRAALPWRRGRPGRVLHCLHRLFAFLPPQDPVPFQPKIIQFVKTGIPPQVII